MPGLSGSTGRALWGGDLRPRIKADGLRVCITLMRAGELCAVPARLRLLFFDMSYWKQKLGELVREWDVYDLSPSDKIFVLNGFVFKGRWRSRPGDSRRILQTTHDACVGEEELPGLVPQGLSVFAPLGTGLERAAYEEMRALFGPGSHNNSDGTFDARASSTGLRVLFLDKKAPVYMPEALDRLSGLGFHELGKFIGLHAQAIRSLTGATQEDMSACSLTLVWYEAGRGMVAHIDGIGDFKKTFGPIFTIAMGEGSKCLDLLPVLTGGGDESPVRVTTKQFEIILLQGAARAAYAHCVPSGCDREQLTIAFKFPEIVGGKQAAPYHCLALGSIPVLVE